MWKITVGRGRPQMTIWRMRNPCWITKATGRHSEYVILNAPPPQQSLHERASRYTCVACLIDVWGLRRMDLTKVFVSETGQ